MGDDSAGTRSYFQRVPLERTAFDASTKMELVSRGRRTALAIGRDIVPLTALGPGAPLPRLRVNADLVFAGYGLVDPSLGRDDLAGLDVKDKAVVLILGAPANADSAKRRELSSFAALGSRLQLLIPRQPAAIIILLPDSVYAQAAGQFVGQLGAPSTGVQPADSQRTFPMVAFGTDRTGSALLPAGWSASSKSGPMTGYRIVGGAATRRETVNSMNVVGVVRGTDASLRGTYVAYGSHFDHIGIQPGQPDSIANGADDDGSGSIAMLALARMYAEGPKPRRSVLFVWHAAEEKGLLGSQYFVNHATVPIDSIIAQLNADMVGRNGIDSLYIVGPAAAPTGQSRTLGEVVNTVNARMAKPFTFNREWDSPTHPERIYFRSDHYSYASKGVPIIFFTSGLHPEYHKVSDEVSKIDFDKMARVTRLLYDVGWEVANRPTRVK